jgi:hypothetical protein
MSKVYIGETVNTTLNSQYSCTLPISKLFAHIIKHLDLPSTVSSCCKFWQNDEEYLTVNVLTVYWNIQNSIFIKRKSSVWHFNLAFLLTSLTM